MEFQSTCDGTGEQHKRLAVERSLEKFRSIGPTIQRLRGRVDPD
jgi:hypothetical protein